MIRESGATTLACTKTGPDPVRVDFSLPAPLGSVFRGVETTAEVLETNESKTSQDIHQTVSFVVTESTAAVRIAYIPVPEPYLLVQDAAPGQENEGLRVVSRQYDSRALILTVEGRPGRSYSLGLLNPELVQSVAGAKLEHNVLQIAFEKKPVGRFIRKDIAIKFKGSAH